jgi:hypothetical protein
MGKKIDLVGMRFGKLTVIRDSEERYALNGAIIWECLCDCGRTIFVKSSNLVRGHTTDCGCFWESKIKELIGQEFGRLTIIGLSDKKVPKRVFVECLCSCGEIITVNYHHLVSGHTQSCGCLKIELQTIHGHAKRDKKSKLYETRSNILQRCYNPKNKFYYLYGGRGIRVYGKWRESFIYFKEDVLREIGPCPLDKDTLDRIDSDGHYEPGNIRWATRKEQTRNTSQNVWYELDGERHIQVDFLKKLNIVYVTLKKWAKQGLTPQQMVDRADKLNLKRQKSA